jgi:hypothetical protein
MTAVFIALLLADQYFTTQFIIRLQTAIDARLTVKIK